MVTQAIIDHKAIETWLAAADAARPETLLPAIINKAKAKQGLKPAEVFWLLHLGQQEPWLSNILDTAREIKEAIYGKRIVFFAPLYISNVCVNNCLYCSYRVDNHQITRKTLTSQEISAEVHKLTNHGHKRLLLVAGEDQSFPSIMEALQVIYSTRKANNQIRRVNVNIAPPTVEEFQQLKKIGIGTYQCFQETYHQATYAAMHPGGPKADYNWRLTVMDRALQAGVDDVSTGVLLGLYDFRYDVTALIMHGQYLEQRYRVGPHAVSIPRLKIAHGTPLCDDERFHAHRYWVNDNQFKLVAAVIRMALPYTGLILSTRESMTMRQELLNAGVTQLSAGSHTEVGGYTKSASCQDQQFEIDDKRDLEQVVNDVINSGNLSSFCTACYRTGRTGEVIMDLLKPGTIKNYCLPNALLTFQEYLFDYAQEETRRKAIPVMKSQLEQLDLETREKTLERLSRIEHGERDLYF